MLGNVEIIECVVDFFVDKLFGMLVLDFVMIVKGGVLLL